MVGVAPAGATDLATKGYVDSLVPVGVVQQTAGFFAPTGWLECNGQAVSRTTYAALFAALNPLLSTLTVNLASPAVFTRTFHNLPTGTRVYLTTTGALPTGISANTAYYVAVRDADTFWLSTTFANAIAGTGRISSSGSQSGTHSFNRSWGVGDGSTTFNVPDLRNNVVAGVNTAVPEFSSPGAVTGELAHVLTTSELPAHDHGGATGSNTVDVNSTIVVAGSNPAGGSHINMRGTATGAVTGTLSGTGHTHSIGSSGANGAHNNVQPTVAMFYIIKT